jgi:hypothetical protein
MLAAVSSFVLIHLYGLQGVGAATHSSFFFLELTKNGNGDSTNFDAGCLALTASFSLDLYMCHQ